jgi:hypothetical protein
MLSASIRSGSLGGLCCAAGCDGCGQLGVKLELVVKSGELEWSGDRTVGAHDENQLVTGGVLHGVELHEDRQPG